jgi:cyclomaltodextrin glucanotransferase
VRDDDATFRRRASRDAGHSPGLLRHARAVRGEHAVYFVVTDRFVNGDPANDHRDQGGGLAHLRPPAAAAPDGESDNLGYLGGDFRGLLDHADYIRDMGFGAVWITPIVDNPDEPSAAATSHLQAAASPTAARPATTATGASISSARTNTCRAPAWISARFTAGLRAKGLKTVLDIVGNHGSPSYTMPTTSPSSASCSMPTGQLVADHQNLPPRAARSGQQPAACFYNTQRRRTWRSCPISTTAIRPCVDYLVDRPT